MNKNISEDRTWQCIVVHKVDSLRLQVSEASGDILVHDVHDCVLKILASQLVCQDIQAATDVDIHFFPVVSADLQVRVIDPDGVELEYVWIFIEQVELLL